MCLHYIRTSAARQSSHKTLLCDGLCLAKPVVILLVCLFYINKCVTEWRCCNCIFVSLCNVQMIINTEYMVAQQFTVVLLVIMSRLIIIK